MPTIDGSPFKKLAKSKPKSCLGSGLPVPGKKKCERTTTKPKKLAQLGREPNWIDVIERDITSLGIVGEVDLGLLLYLVLTSRILKRPLGMIISGPSSSGKSTIPATVAEMMPPEDMIHATSMTPNALYYGEPDWLKHKALMFGELSHRSDDEQADKTAAVRQLISEGKITKVVTQNIDGKSTTQTIEQNGPVAFCATTTLSREKIFAEDVNRLLFVRTNDSVAQTKNVMLATASRYMSETPIVDRQAILDRHREFQRSLKQCDVMIPFAEKLAQAMPATRIEARRVFQQVLSTIEAVVVLHQHQRDRDNAGRLVATATDYEIARKLLLQPLNKSIGLSEREQKAYGILREKFASEFNSEQALKAGPFNNKMTRDRTLKELESLGLIEKVSAGKSHQSARWTWTEKSLDELILPSAKSVFVTTQQVTRKQTVTKTHRKNGRTSLRNNLTQSRGRVPDRAGSLSHPVLRRS